jgi:hypothetical protein
MDWQPIKSYEPQAPATMTEAIGPLVVARKTLPPTVWDGSTSPFDQTQPRDGRPCTDADLERGGTLTLAVWVTHE